jgi:hypothetical protein
MGLGVSLILIAAGAILAWGVNANASGVDIDTIGYILLIVGAVGALLALALWSTWWGPGYWSERRRAPARPPSVSEEQGEDLRPPLLRPSL